MGPPKALDWPNPMSSISTMRTLGALAGAFTSNRGGGVAFRTSNTVLCGYVGSEIGSTVRSVGNTTRRGVAPWAITGAAVSGANTSTTARMRANAIDVLITGFSSLPLLAWHGGGHRWDLGLIRGSFLEYVVTSPRIEMPHRAVEVDRRLFDAREEGEDQRPIVDGVSRLHTDLAKERHVVGRGVRRAVHALADAVANGRRSEQREDDIRTGRDAPEAERLTEVFLARAEPGDLARVEQPAETERAVEHEPGDFAQRAFPLSLEEAVDEPWHPRDVVDGVTDHDLRLLGHDSAVAAGDRLQRVLVHVVVEREHLFVERLPGIVLFGVQITAPPLGRGDCQVGSRGLRRGRGHPSVGPGGLGEGSAAGQHQPGGEAHHNRRRIRSAHVVRPPTTCSSFSAPPSMGCWSHMRISGPRQPWPITRPLRTCRSERLDPSSRCGSRKSAGRSSSASCRSKTAPTRCRCRRGPHTSWPRSSPCRAPGHRERGGQRDRNDQRFTIDHV